jgi:haloacetate dehalogenase
LSVLFEGFETRRVGTPGVDVHVRIGGGGPPVLLLHGYPQTGAMWHAVAPALAEQFTVVVPDLPGYGASSKPPSTENHAAYSKRGMASTLVHAIRSLGFERWLLAGHDRGARAAYRMALDHPQRVEKLATLDIVPTYSTWEAMNWRSGMGSYHWQFLAQPAPLPERLIGSDPVFYLRNTLARWAAPGFDFHPEALAEYERAFSNPETVRACCEDYRAGATIDYELDKADHGTRKITCPMLALWGQRPGSPPRNMLPTWREWAEDVRGGPVPCGHFLAEEAPEKTLAELQGFFA